MKYLLLLVGTALILTWIFSDANNFRGKSVKQKHSQLGKVHHKFDKPNVIEAIDELDSSADTGDDVETAPAVESEGVPSNFSRPFKYIGDIDPALPLPWPKEEKDWWALHETLVQRVKASDEMPPNVSENHLPQLVFYGDSITEAWNGTSFGNIPGPTRMWGEGETEKIRQVFSKHFGAESAWGRRALLPPLILGISGSRTYDFIWRIENGEFPTSQLIKAKEGDKSFNIKNLERVYIVLMGTNNLGGGMLPDQTISGMDASGRRILELHQQYSPNTPAAILFSELLPRKDDHRAVKMCPPRCANTTNLTPYKSFMPAIEKVNKAMPSILRRWRDDYPNSKIILLSSQSNGNNNEDANTLDTIRCGQDMFAFDNDDEFDAYMPDRLHPNAKGYDIWARCIKRGLEDIMDHTIELL